MSASAETKKRVRENLEAYLDEGEEEGTKTITVGEVFDLLADPTTMDLYDQFTDCDNDPDNVTGWLRNISSNYYCSEVKSPYIDTGSAAGFLYILVLRKL